MRKRKLLVHSALLDTPEDCLLLIFNYLPQTFKQWATLRVVCKRLYQSSRHPNWSKWIVTRDCDYVNIPNEALRDLGGLQVMRRRLSEYYGVLSEILASGQYRCDDAPLASSEMTPEAPSNTIMNALSGMTNLKDLSITRAAKLTSLDFLMPLQNLRILGLAGIENVANLEPLWSLTALQTLRLAGAEKVTDAALRGISSLVNLERLEIVGLPLVTHVNVVSNIRLKELVVDLCRNLTHVAVALEPLICSIRWYGPYHISEPGTFRK
jgi:hypothetical protein